MSMESFQRVAFACSPGALDISVYAEEDFMQEMCDEFVGWGILSSTPKQCKSIELGKKLARRDAGSKYIEGLKEEQAYEEIDDKVAAQ